MNNPLNPKNQILNPKNQILNPKNQILKPNNKSLKISILILFIILVFLSIAFIIQYYTSLQIKNSLETLKNDYSINYTNPEVNIIKGSIFFEKLTLNSETYSLILNNTTFYAHALDLLNFSKKKTLSYIKIQSPIFNLKINPSDTVLLLEDLELELDASPNTLNTILELEKLSNILLNINYMHLSNKSISIKFEALEPEHFINTVTSPILKNLQNLKLNIQRTNSIIAFDMITNNSQTNSYLGTLNTQDPFKNSLLDSTFTLKNPSEELLQSLYFIARLGGYSLNFDKKNNILKINIKGTLDNIKLSS